MKTEINYTFVSKKILKPNCNCWLVKYGLGFKIGSTFDGMGGVKSQKQIA